jgi:uncharacterized cupredoxin-like copper-binding protein
MTVGRTVAALGLGLAVAVLVGIGAGAVTRASEPLLIPITIHYSHFEPARITVQAGRPVTFVITNSDPIDHEWIVGDAASHERHRTGTEPVHGARPTEISIPAGTERRTTVTFAAPGSQLFICHLPGHEAYGMTGTLTIN